MTTKIEWSDETWNPVVGCRRVSAGCEHCYAETMAHRLAAMGQERYKGLTVLGKAGRRWAGHVNRVPEVLDKPLRWRKPRMVFVNSMSDLFHEDVPFEYIAAVFGVMASAPRHTFQVLTKRPERMLEWFRWAEERHAALGYYPFAVCLQEASATAVNLLGVGTTEDLRRAVNGDPWPLPNVWIGVSCENQETADERIPLLLQCPAAVHWVSAEPLLGPINFDPPHCQYCDFRMEEISLCDDGTTPWCMQCDSEAVYGHWLDPLNGGISWVVVGGESGPGARPCALNWIEIITNDCRLAGAPVFVKQLGAYVVDEGRCDGDGDWAWRAGLTHPKGGNPEEWPQDLRVRQWPQGVTSNG